MPRYFTALFLLCCACLHSQTDTLNRLDAEGKKHGFWKVYLDEKLIPANESEAVFYAYEQYDHGTELFTFESLKFKSNTDVQYSAYVPPKGKPEILNGTIKRIDKKSALLTTSETYSNGHPVRIKEYAPLPWKPDSVYVTEELCFDLTCNSVPGTYQLQERYTNGQVEKYWFRKGKQGWKIYPCLNFDCQEDEIMYLHNIKDPEKVVELTGDKFLDIKLVYDTSKTGLPQSAVLHGYLLNIDNKTATFSVSAEDFVMKKKPGKLSWTTNNYPMQDSGSKNILRTVQFKDIASVNYFRVRPVSHFGAGVAAVGAFCVLVLSPALAFDYDHMSFKGREGRLVAYEIPSTIMLLSGLTVKYVFSKKKHYYVNQVPANCRNCKRYVISDK